MQKIIPKTPNKKLGMKSEAEIGRECEGFGTAAVTIVKTWRI